MDRNNEQRACHFDTASTELKHAGELLAALNQLRRDAALCDVLLQVQSENSNELVKEASNTTGVLAHRVVLAAASPYFCAMFTSNFKERTTQTVVIKGIELESLQRLVEYIYSPASLSVTIENAEALLAAATLLDIAGVRDAVCAFLLNALAVDNVLGIRAFAELHSCATLAAAATRYINEHGERVLEGDELLALEPEVLAALLDNKLMVTEERVLDAVLRWTRHHPEKRKQHLASLLCSVRLSLVPLKVLEDSASTEPLASAEPKVLHLVKEALSADREAPVALFVIGGWSTTGCSNSVRVCPLSGGHWQFATKLPAQRATAGAALLNGNIHVVGGWDGYSSMSTVFIYNAAIDSWSLGPEMTTARKWPGVTALAGRLYAVGGWNGTSTSCIRFNSVEALDPREGMWRTVASMVTRRSALGVAVLDGSLYAVGGYDGNALLNSAERYDPRADTWETVESMAKRRSGVGVAVVDDAMYVAGGWDGFNASTSVERYRAGSGWEYAPPMVAPMYNTAVTAHGGRLYVAGGRHNQYLTSVSVLDPATGWSELPALPLGCDVAAAIVAAWPPSP